MRLAIFLVLYAALATPSMGQPPSGGARRRDTPARADRRTAAAALRAPNPHNRFVTVAEFRQARRAPGANVSIEGYVVLAEKSGAGSVRMSLVDSTDKVLTAKEAQDSARAGARCLAASGGKQHPNWVLTRKGLLRLAMYCRSGTKCEAVNDSPPKVRIQGAVSKDRAGLATVTRIEYHDDNGEFRELK